jgi:hypothetical protein
MKIFLTTLLSGFFYATYIAFVRYMESLAEHLPDRVKRVLLRRI